MVSVVEDEGNPARLDLLRCQALNSSLGCYWHESWQHSRSIYNHEVSNDCRTDTRTVSSRARVIRDTLARVVEHLARISNCISNIS
jgi:hypothetical protein